MRMFSLRRILAVSLVLLAIVPALLVAWVMGRASSQAVEGMAGKTLEQLGTLVQVGTEAHLRQAHDVLNGLFPERLGPADIQRARMWLHDLRQFHAPAFALARQSPDTPVLHFGNRAGEYLRVESAPDGVKLADREGAGLEPRTTGWYRHAMEAKDRVFSPVEVSPQRRQLVVSLSQPVFESDGGAAGVFATELQLQTLASVLRTQRLTARGAAFVVDEKGLLVASSAGDPLFTQEGATFLRRSPEQSANPVIRASFAALKTLRANRSADSVAADTRLQRLPQDGDPLLMVQRPFGESFGVRWTLVVAAPESDFTAEINRAWKVALGGGAALVALGTLIAFLLAHGIGRKLGRLGIAAEQLGRGEVPVIEEKTRIQEVRRLSQVLHCVFHPMTGTIPR